jgi:hypothetical protein
VVFVLTFAGDFFITAALVLAAGFFEEASFFATAFVFFCIFGLFCHRTPQKMNRKLAYYVNTKTNV